MKYLAAHTEHTHVEITYSWITAVQNLKYTDLSS